MKDKPKPNEGDNRTVDGFLYLPKLINREWRWLERATRTQMAMVRISCAPEGDCCFDYIGWVDMAWGDSGGQDRDNINVSPCIYIWLKCMEARYNLSGIEPTQYEIESAIDRWITL